MSKSGGVLEKWALLMSETYAKQNDCKQSEYYYRMAQYFKEQEKKRGETR